MLINVKILTIVGILTSISMNTTSESFKARKVYIFQHFSYYEQLKFHVRSWSVIKIFPDHNFPLAWINKNFERKIANIFYPSIAVYLNTKKTPKLRKDTQRRAKTRKDAQRHAKKCKDGENRNDGTKTPTLHKDT